jgi:cytochrome c-type biogenesis protein CcmH
MRRLAHYASIAALLCGLAHARAEAPMEARVMQIAEGLRCLVCQNETLAASQAALAVDLRAQIREQLEQGQGAEQIRDYMVARYGDYVLYRPPWRASTVLLWLGPLALLAAALLWAVRLLRSQRSAQRPPLDPLDAARADELLGLHHRAGGDDSSGRARG